MIILAIDSSGLTATAAIYADGIIVSSYSVNNKKTHSQTLLTMIKCVIDSADIKIEQIDAIAVAEGPGSFTGLRIGASTVKGLGLAMEVPVIPVSTLAALAYNMAGYDGLICPIMDARRNQVYTASYYYDYENDGLKEVMAPCAIGIDEVVGANKDCDNIMFVGDGVPVFREYIEEQLGNKAHFAMPHIRYQDSASVAVLAGKLWEEGKYVSPEEFNPVYLRMSQAEREKLENESKNDN